MTFLSSRLRAEIECRDFSGTLSRLNGGHILEFDLEDLVWAAIMVGYPNFDHLIGRRGQEELWANTHRASIVFAYLASDAEGNLRKSEAFQRSDRSEKGSFSYYFGLILAKLTASLLIDVPLLWHFDAYANEDDPAITLRQRPDLVGVSWLDDWYVIEAKGRSRGFSAAERDSAKAQASAVTRLRTRQGWRTPTARIASFVFFYQETLRMRWDDPIGKKPIRLNVAIEKLVTNYYRPVRLLGAGLPKSTLRIHGQPFRAFHMVDADVWLGSTAELVENRVDPLTDVMGSLSKLGSRTNGTATASTQMKMVAVGPGGSFRTALSCVWEISGGNQVPPEGDADPDQRRRRVVELRNIRPRCPIHQRQPLPFDARRIA